MGGVTLANNLPICVALIESSELVCTNLQMTNDTFQVEYNMFSTGLTKYVCHIIRLISHCLTGVRSNNALTESNAVRDHVVCGRDRVLASLRMHACASIESESHKIAWDLSITWTLAIISRSAAKTLHNMRSRGVNKQQCDRVYRLYSTHDCARARTLYANRAVRPNNIHEQLRAHCPLR